MNDEPKYSMLFVEDDNTARIIRSFKMIFSKNFNINRAHSAIEGLTKYEENPFYDIIITDLEFNKHEEKFSGYDLIKRIRKVNLYIPIVVLTNYEEKHFEIEAKKCGASLFLKKSEPEYKYWLDSA